MNNLIEDLAGWAVVRPDSPAVELADESISYRQLDEQSTALAAALRARGVAPGDRVALWLRKSTAAVVAVYGVLKSNATYVPIDPSAPVSRVAKILIDCEVSGVVADAEHVEWLGAHRAGAGYHVVSVGEPGVRDDWVTDWTAALATRSRPPGLPSTPEDPAYILYTSGSTGTPKGVVLTHRNATAFVSWTVAEFALRPTDRVASHAPFHFDLSILDIFATCRAGGCLVLVPEAYAGLGGALNRMVTRRGITVWYSVPGALTRMLAADNSTLLTGSALRVVLFAGEVFPLAGLRQLRALLPGANLCNLYGPTETNVCTFHRVRDADLESARTEPVPIGRDCPYAHTFLGDPDGRPLPHRAGQVGELYVTGASVMSGYWGDKTLTDAKLTTAVHMNRSCPAYRTGDIVRLNEAGEYVFCGRRDEQVKIRGHRVELGDIEAVLSAVDDVREVACVAVGVEGEDMRVEAYVVLADGRCDLSRLRAECLAALPRYMVPQQFHLIEALPRTGTGKVDRRALPGR